MHAEMLLCQSDVKRKLYRSFKLNTSIKSIHLITYSDSFYTLLLDKIQPHKIQQSAKSLIIYKIDHNCDVVSICC